MEINENYANQELEEYVPSNGEMTVELHRRWSAEKNAGLKEETIEELKAKASAGSYMAARMLCLSEITWDMIVAGEQFEYIESPAHFSEGRHMAEPRQQRSKEMLTPKIRELLESQGITYEPRETRELDSVYYADSGRPTSDES